MNTEVINDSPANLAWFKSSYSGAEGGDCVEVADCLNAVHVRDSKVEEGPMLSLSPQSWATFVGFAAKR